MGGIRGMHNKELLAVFLQNPRDNTCRLKLTKQGSAINGSLGAVVVTGAQNEFGLIHPLDKSLCSSVDPTAPPQ